MANSVSLSSKCQLLKCSMQIRKVDRQKTESRLFKSDAVSELSVSRSIFDLKEENQTNGDSYCRTIGHMLMPDSSLSPVRNGGGWGVERHKSNGQQRRDRACHKSKALYYGARGSERVTNQTN